MKKKGGLIAIMLILIFAMIGCSNDTAVNDNSDKYEDYLALIYASQPDTSWYYNQTATTYELNSANDLLGLMTLVNSGDDFTGKTVNLAKGTYDFSRWTVEGMPSYIGAGDRGDVGSARAFKGSFNGNGSIIRGVDLSYDTYVSGDEDGKAVGFFGMVVGTADDPVTIENIVFEDVNIVSESNTAGIAVGYAEYANIKNIVVRNSTIRGPQGVGAVVGRLYQGGTIEDCTNINTSVYATADGTVDYTDGSGSGNYNAGGIVGCVKGTTAAASLTVSGNTVDLGSNAVIFADYLTAGGICGTSSNATFNDNDVTIASDSQISVTTPASGKAAAIVANANSNTVYGADSNVNTITIGSQSKSITSAAEDTLTIGQ